MPPTWSQSFLSSFATASLRMSSRQAAAWPSFTKAGPSAWSSGCWEPKGIHQSILLYIYIYMYVCVSSLYIIVWYSLIHTYIHTYIHYITLQYSTVQYITSHHNTIQYNTIHKYMCVCVSMCLCHGQVELDFASLPVAMECEFHGAFPRGWEMPQVNPWPLLPRSVIPKTMGFDTFADVWWCALKKQETIWLTTYSTKFIALLQWYPLDWF